MKRFIPRRFKNVIKTFVIHPAKRYLFHRYIRCVIKPMRYSSQPIAFILATPEHGNLGDHAIVLSEKYMLANAGFKNRVVEIPNSDFLLNKDIVCSYIKESDLIIVDGGGNLGSLWPWEDDKITDIISTFINNPIIIFPQTCYYADTIEAKRRLVSNNKVYKRANKLTIALRDIRSFEYCRANFSSNVNLFLVPDIVLSLTRQIKISENNRNGVLFCFRDDHERVINSDSLSDLIKFVELKDISYKETTTVLPHSVSRDSRLDILQSKFEEFSNAKLVITDRLHAMIFASITNTPCLAFDNLSKKVSGVFEVSGKLYGIEICSSIENVKDLFDKYYSLSIDNNTFDFDKYNELISIIKKNI